MIQVHGNLSFRVGQEAICGKRAVKNENKRGEKGGEKPFLLAHKLNLQLLFDEWGQGRNMSKFPGHWVSSPGLTVNLYNSNKSVSFSSLIPFEFSSVTYLQDFNGESLAKPHKHGVEMGARHPPAST